MKNIKSVLVIALAFGAIGANAQQVLQPFYLHSPRVGTYQNASVTGVYAKESARDSVNSSTTVLAPTNTLAYAQDDSIKLNNSYTSGVIQFTLTKASGTVAGSVYLQGSVDGTQWQNIGDTLTLANNTTNNFFWELPGRTRYGNGGKYDGFPVPYGIPNRLPYLYYRVYIAGTGTWCGTFYSAICPRQ